MTEPQAALYARAVEYQSPIYRYSNDFVPHQLQSALGMNKCLTLPAQHGRHERNAPSSHLPTDPPDMTIKSALSGNGTEVEEGNLENSEGKRGRQ